MSSRAFFYSALGITCAAVLGCGVPGTHPREGANEQEIRKADTIHTRFIRSESFWLETDVVAFLDTLTADPSTQYVIESVPDSAWYDPKFITILQQETASTRSSGVYQLLWESAAPAPIVERTRGYVAKRLIRAMPRRRL